VLNHLCFFALGWTFLSLWFRRSLWIWGAFLLIALALAYQAHIIQSFALIPIGILFLTHWMLKEGITGWKRVLLFLITCGVSVALSLHLMPGFHNIQISSHPSFWLNFDKPFIGLFALAFSIPLIASRTRLREVLTKTAPLTFLGIAAIMAIAIFGGLVSWDPSIPLSLLWIPVNLVLVTIPEEAFYRGFIQHELFKWLGGRGIPAGLGAVLLTSLLFTLLHVGWAPSVPFLALVFVASLIYGGIYQYTKAIEASIFCHFLLNLTHFLFFTYP
jgi:membrane protease YdiL (CAAX protease family)